MTSAQIADVVIVAVIGATVGAGELTSRYRDAPARALLCGPALLYMAINAGASCAALSLITAFDWSFGAETPDSRRWTQVLVAGFGAMVLFRSSLFVVRVGSQDVGIGPSSVLAALLSVSDRGVDRIRGTKRAQDLNALLEGITWARARTDLPVLCLGLMQNATSLEKDALASAVRDIDAGDLDDDVRVLLVGLELMNLAGIGVLTGAVALLNGGSESAGAAGDTVL